MSADLVAIHKGVAAVIKNGISREVNVYPFPTVNPDLPYVMVMPGDPYVDYWGTMSGNGFATVNLEIQVETNNQDGETAHTIMAELLSAGGVRETSSIPDAIMADRTARDTLSDCVPTSCSYEVDAESNNPIGRIAVQGVLKKNGANA